MQKNRCAILQVIGCDWLFGFVNLVFLLSICILVNRKRVFSTAPVLEKKSHWKYPSFLFLCKFKHAQQGPRSKILSGGAQAWARVFFLGGGGGGAEACYPGKIRVLVTFRYQKVDLKWTNSVLKRNVFTTCNSNGPQTTMVLTYQDLKEILAIYLRRTSSWHYLDLLHHADESQKGRNGCPRL